MSDDIYPHTRCVDPTCENEKPGHLVSDHSKPNSDLYVFMAGQRLERRWFQYWQEMADMHSKKNADYGERDKDPYANFRKASRVGVEPWRGALVRMLDKISRIETFATHGNLQNESFEDSLMDLAVYCLIVRSLFNESSEPVSDTDQFTDQFLMGHSFGSD